MRLMSALRSAVVASLLLALPALAAESTPAPAPAPTAEQGVHLHGYRGHRVFGREGKLLRMERRIDRAVAEGRLTQVQAEQFKAEGRQLREELKAQREAAGGQLSDDQKEKMRERMREFRQKVKSAIKPKDAQK